MAIKHTEHSHSTIWNAPNVVTMVRICLVPVFVVALLSPWPEWMGLHDLIDKQLKAIIAAAVFVVISATDWVDGYLARKNKQVTDFGKFLDPLADKILVAAALIALVELQVIPSWPVLIIISREFIVSGIRMVAATKNVVIAASIYGKWKTVLQIVAIVLFIVKDSLVIPNAEAAISNPLYVLSWIVMIAALVMTVLSMLDYIAKARDLLFTGTDNKNEEGSMTKDVQFLQIAILAQKIVDEATKKKLTIATAESLTGGLISTTLTEVPGSSSVFLGGFTTYANSVKENVLGVDGKLLQDKGAVDGEVAIQMAQGAASKTGADIAVAVTGIAGPTGEEPGKPVGTVYFGVYDQGKTYSERKEFSGNRSDIRYQTTQTALELMMKCLDS